MDDRTHTQLMHIRDKALDRADQCIDNGNWDSACKAIDIARDADHICRKWWTLKREHPDWMK